MNTISQVKEPVGNWVAISNSKDCLYGEDYNPMSDK